MQLFQAKPIVYECGPWAWCELGAACPQAVTQRAPRYRLELFKTSDGRGWGVRSLVRAAAAAAACCSDSLLPWGLRMEPGALPGARRCRKLALTPTLWAPSGRC